MSLTMRCPDAKAMELGGVDTGSMKAYEHPIVAGTMKYKGFTETRIAYRNKQTNIKIPQKCKYSIVALVKESSKDRHRHFVGSIIANVCYCIWIKHYLNRQNFIF